MTPDGARLFDGVYVANASRGDVSVIDVASESVTNTIPVGLVPVSIASTPAGTTAYVADLRGNSIAVIDVASEAVTGPIGVGASPRDVAFAVVRM